MLLSTCDGWCVVLQGALESPCPLSLLRKDTVKESFHTVALVSEQGDPASPSYF